MSPRPAPTKHASAFVISITPFTESGALDDEAARGHYRRLAAAGIGVYVGGGGSGEGYTLAPDETRHLLELAVDELKGKVPVRAMGVEPRTAQQMIDFMALAKSVGVDAAQLYSLEVGHGHRPTMDEVERYLTDVLETTEIPCIISTHQSVGYKVPVVLLDRLVSRYETVIGINCSHADVRYLREIVDAVGDRVDVHVGGEAQALVAWAAGATGFLSSVANVAPKLAMSVVDSYNAGELTATFDAFDRLNRFAGLVYEHGGILAQKAFLNSLGLPGGYPRRPHLPVTDEVVAKVAALADELDIQAVEQWSTNKGE
jgi:4-hydroxy-tetrahydrodipicolinate synthase